MRFLRYIILLAFLPFVAYGQSSSRKNWEIGGFLGAANYLGDMAPDFALKETRPVVGANIKYNFNSYFSLGGQVNCGWIAGNDSNFEATKYRGLAFRSNILEVSGIAEFNFFRFGNSPRDSRFTPYLFTGLSFFKFNPIGYYKDNKYFLQSMTTEGQGMDSAPKKYSLLQFAIPIGAGLKFKLQDNLNMTVSVGYRGTFTDYLDDVSGQYVDSDLLRNYAGDESVALADPNSVGRPGKQRGTSPFNNDWYVFAGISLSYVLPGRICYTF